MKLNANMEKAFAHRVASPGFSNAQQANARSNGVCYSWDGHHCRFGSSCKFAQSHIRGQVHQKPGLGHNKGGHQPAQQYGNHYPRIEEA